MNKKVLFVPIIILLLWIILFQTIILGIPPLQASLGIVDQLEVLFTDAAFFLGIALGLLILFVATLLPATILLDLFCFSKIEYLLEEYLLKGRVLRFFKYLLYFDQVPKPKSIVPKTISGAVFSVSIIYLFSLIFTVYYGEVLFYIASSYASQISFNRDAALLTPLLALFLVYVARILVFLEYPRAADLILFIPLSAFWLLTLALYAYFYRFSAFTSYWGTLFSNGELPFVARSVLYFSILPIALESILWVLDYKRNKNQ